MLFDFLGNAFLGWLFADLCSGLSHYFGDVYGDHPMMRRLVTFNADHHRRPLDIVNTPFWKRNATTFPAALLISSFIYIVSGLTPFLITALIGGLLVTEAHRWAHAPSTTTRLVRSLQRIGALQSPKHHAKHHRPPHELNFCLLTDWLNPMIDALRGVAR